MMLMKLMAEMTGSTDFSLICPANDGEAVTILALARELGLDVRESRQGWGAALDKEPPESFDGLKKHVIIVEMPGPEKEAELGLSHRLHLVDHHIYAEFDRRSPLSSLEQFAALVGVELDRWQMGVALNDRGYISALRASKYSEDEIMEIRRFDLAAQGYVKKDFIALADVFSHGRVFDDRVLIVKTPMTRISYLADLNWFENERRASHLDLLVFSIGPSGAPVEINYFGAPGVARDLFKEMGGYLGGDDAVSMFWGKPYLEGINKDSFLARFSYIIKGD